MARKTTANMPMTLRPPTVPMKPATMASMTGASITKKAARKPATKKGRRK